MSNCVAFHTQIASIMEVLANAAVAEICKLVDDGYAVLRLEMSQSQKENKALKRKLQMMELRVARACAEKNSVNARPQGVQGCEKMRRTVTESHFPGEGGVFTRPLDGQRRDGDAADTDQDHTGVQHNALRAECADMEEGRTEPLLIKEERLEEESDPLGKLNIKDGPVESRPGGGERPPIQEVQNKAANHTEELSEQQRTRHGVWECVDGEERKPESLLVKEEGPEQRNCDPRGELRERENRAVETGGSSRARPASLNTQAPPAGHSEELTGQHRTMQRVWEVSGPESALKAEQPNDSVKKRLQHRGTELRAGGLDSLDSAEFVMFDRPGQLGTYCMQGSANTETEDPCCSYSAETDPESLSFHSEMQSTTVAGTLGGNSVALGPADVNLETVMTGSASFHVEDEIHTVWNKDTNSVSQYGLYNLERNSETQPVNDTSSCAPYTSVQTREKLFICTYCGKGFNRPKKLEIHQRIHTGEKPFSCALCGKRFAQSCNLNRHKIVHTGEKPFGCTQCDKRFSQSCHLKTHQRVHTKGRPYSWNRFSDKRSLRFQQHRKHTGL